jgi:hypothetical protein
VDFVDPIWNFSSRRRIKPSYESMVYGFVALNKPLNRKVDSMKRPKTLMVITVVPVLFAAVIVTSCSKNPISSTRAASAATLYDRPGYEPAYVNDTTVTINAIEVRQNPTEHAQADFYEVVYPFDPMTGEELPDYWPSDPQCNPCDHQGNGITPDDFHDHVLDSQPSNPGHGEYNALWHVYLIMPNYTDNADHNEAVNSTLESMLPVMSEDGVDSLLSTQVDGMPLAVEIDTEFYFICAVVNEHAGGH